MTYAKERTGMTQCQVVENLRAVISSDYFRAYDCESARFSSDLLSADLRRGYGLQDGLKVADITDTFANLLETASNRGTLSEAVVGLRPSDEMLRGMQFEEQLYDEGLELPLTVSVRREGTTKDSIYRFSVVNLGLKESYFESQGLDFKSAQAKVIQWYREVTRNLKQTLPHEFNGLTFSK